MGAAIFYQLAMVYGFIRLASFWGVSRTRGINELVFLFLGVVVPLAGWFFSIFFWPLAFVLPGSLGLVWWLARSNERRERAAGEAVLAEQRAAGYAMIAVDARNAVGHWTLGKVLEEERMYEKALQQYERAHALSEDTIDRHEMEDIRHRIAALIESQKEEALPRPVAERVLSWSGLETLFLALGVVLVLENVFLAVNLCSMMLFIRWFRDSRPVVGKIECH